MESRIKKALEILDSDPEFITRLEASIKNIMKDNKIDHHDIPDIVMLITDTITTMSTVNIEKNDIPDLVKLVYQQVVEKFNLIPEDRRPEFERLVESATRLVMFQPAVNQGINNLINSMGLCCGSRKK